MGFPGEEIVSKAIEKISDGVIAKMEQAEARREREFTLKLKELEYYKSNYDKELRNIFDFWFELVYLTQIKDNKHLSDQEKAKYQKKYDEKIKVDKIGKLKIDTLKYGGQETGRIFALESKLHQSVYNDQPKATPLYMWCSILAVLKKDILGQDIDPMDIIQVLVTDFNDNIESINAAKNYIKFVYEEYYGEKPFWIGETPNEP